MLLADTMCTDDPNTVIVVTEGLSGISNFTAPDECTSPQPLYPTAQAVQTPDVDSNYSEKQPARAASSSKQA